MTVEVIGDDDAIREIGAISDRASDWRPISLDLGLIIQADVDERYQSAPGVRSGGQVYGGQVWPQLSDAYLAANPRREGGIIGLDTGRSRQSFTANAAGNIFETGPQEVAFGSSLPEVRGFHTGKGDPSKARPLIFAHDELVETFSARLQEWIVEGK